MSAPAGDGTTGELTTRERILEATLELTARKGSDAMGMRELAQACGVNVAAIYYHFPSKADLLRAVIEERHYELMLGLVEVPPAGDRSDRARLRALMRLIWEGVRDEERIWRLLLAEGCHHNGDAQEVATSLVTRFEAAAAHWIGEEFDGLAVPAPVAARLMSDHLFSNIARVAIGAVTDADVERHAADLVDVIIGD